MLKSKVKQKSKGEIINKGLSLFMADKTFSLSWNFLFCECHCNVQL